MLNFHNLKIKWKIILPYSLLIFLIMGSLLAWYITSIAQYMADQQLKKMDIVIQEMGNAVSFPLSILDYEGIHKSFKHLSEIDEDIRYVVLQVKNGQTVASVGKPFPKQSMPIRGFLQTKELSSGVHLVKASGNVLDYEMQHHVKIYNTDLGKLYIGVSSAKTSEIINRFIVINIIVGIGAVIIGIFMFVGIIQALVNKPIQELNSVSTLISSGHFEKRISYSSQDELGELSESFNNMASKLQQMLMELNQQNMELEKQITERRLIEETIKKSSALLRNIVDSIPDLIFYKDKQSVYQGCNKAFSHLVETKEEDVLGKTDYDLFPNELADSFRDKDRTIFTEGEPNRNEEWVTYRDGKKVLFDTLKTPYYDPDGNMLGLIGISRDITERKRSEETLRLFKLLVESSSDAIGMSTPEGSHYYQNEAFTVLFGEIGEDPPATLYVDQAVGREVFEAIMAGRRWEGEVRMYAKDRKILSILLRAYANKDTAGRVIGLVGIHTDITERKRSEEEKEKLQAQLLQAQKMETIGHFAGGVAHDFNNALTAIIGFAHILKNRLKENEQLAHNAEQIISASNRAALTVSSLLAFSRKQAIQMKTVNINDIVLGITKILDRFIGEDINLQANTADNDLIVNVDTNQIEQVIMNLTTNARDAMPGGGTLTMATEEIEIDENNVHMYKEGVAGKYAVLSVTDTGMGIDEKTMENIFDPFFTTKEVGKGTGLGLAMIYGTIKQHNGFINVYSEPEKGTTFKIYLPLAESTVNVIEKKGASPVPSGTETVLLAEDDEKVRYVTRTLLEGYGYSVIEAVDGKQAVELFRENRDRVHLVITDVIMPGQSGKDLHDELMKIINDIKVIFISGYSADILAKKGIIDTDINFISKPVNPEILLRKIRKVLDD